MKVDFNLIPTNRRSAFLCFCFACLLFSFGCSRRSVPETFEELEVYPAIYPDYVETTLPFNVAPANFRIEVEAQKYVVRLTSAKGSVFIFSGRDVIIPEKQWRRALEESRGETATFDIFVRQNSKWKKFRSFKNAISPDPIDPWIAYRLIEPGYEFGHRICLAQRSLESFTEEVFADNRSASTSPCLNCHSFQNWKTDRFLFHFRQNGTDVVQPGTIVVDGKTVRKINARFEAGGTACTYPSWRPTGDYVAFSANQTRQFFHSLSTQKVEVYDFASDLVLLDVVKNELVPIFNTANDFETFPYWSHDGKSLYYCNAHVDVETPVSSPEARQREISKRIDEFHYNIMKIDFDETTKTFGTPEVVVDAASQDKSALFPRSSPDGNWLVYTMAKSGTFPIWRPEANLYIKNLRTGEERRLDEINSDNTESYHSWSSSGKWLVFSSRREDGQYTRLYFTHVDENGRASKPFSLPQKDPRHNWNRFKSYNVPEFISERIEVNGRAVVDAFNEKPVPTTNR
ncbi:MAG: PD40 domain-containing protein [Thermoguttaceae bacterium]|nr:PD40 domain-containing protein [Thermoguttaceae bacterium]